jgi:lipopolysaccharide transport system ATP-binding protein
MSHAVVEFHAVSKRYQLGSGAGSLRDFLARVGRRALGRGAVPKVDFWALRNVSFEAQPGDILGIIGHNGAGKSTALKLLSGVTYPTSGSVRVSGRLAALIELGAGFHPDLSGRENIFLNGAILGLKDAEIRAQFDSIVAFAGLEQFIDTPVKRYSSGMYVRLAFAVAAHVRADVLLIDEVLSVGDAAFQQKCLDKMRELHHSGATIVFVSHSLWTVQQFCNRALLLRKGAIQATGSPADVIELYRRTERDDLLSAPGEADPTEAAPEMLIINSATTHAEHGCEQQAFDFNATVRLRVRFTARARIATPLLLVRVCRTDGFVCFALNNSSQPVQPMDGRGEFEVLLGPLPLVPDIYAIDVLVTDRNVPIIYGRGRSATFRINGALTNSADSGVFAPDAVWLPPQKHLEDAG